MSLEYVRLKNRRSTEGLDGRGGMKVTDFFLIGLPTAQHRSPKGRDRYVAAALPATGFPSASRRLPREADRRASKASGFERTNKTTARRVLHGSAGGKPGATVPAHRQAPQRDPLAHTTAARMLKG